MESSKLTAGDVAEMLNVRVDHVYQLCRSKLIPHFRVGRLIRFEQDQIERWISDGGSPL